MSNQQDFPVTNGQIIDPETGALTFQWYQFFVTLWTRSGSVTGNSSATFNYPTTNGNPLQVLTSAGSGNPSFWSNVKTALSQFTNDEGFINTASLTPYSTTAQMNTAIDAEINARESNIGPPLITTASIPGTSNALARADHTHGHETDPVYSSVSVGTASWTFGAGAPSSVQGNGSIYSNTTGTTGSRLYVSNGTTWAAVSGV